MKFQPVFKFRVAEVMVSTVLFCALATAEEPVTGYLLGPNDQVSVSLRDVKEIDFKPVRIDSAGNIQLHYVGTLHAAGLTTDQLSKFIAARLTDYVNEPIVSVEVTE